jgi:hypothetical protein
MGVANLTGVTFDGGGTGPASLNSGTGDTMATDWACAIDITLDLSSADDINIFTAAGDSADFTLTYDGGLRQLKSKIGVSAGGEDKVYSEYTFPNESDRIQVWFEGAETGGDVVYTLYYRLPSAAANLDLDDTTGRITVATVTISTATLSGFVTRDIWIGGIIGSSPHAPVAPLKNTVTLWQAILNFDSNEHLRYDGEAADSLPADWEVRDSAQTLIADTTLTDATDSFLPTPGDYENVDGLGALNARVQLDQGGEEQDLGITAAINLICGFTVNQYGSPQAALEAAGATAGLSLIAMLNELSGASEIAYNASLQQFAELYTP